jgi:hypothetical protein
MEWMEGGRDARTHMHMYVRARRHTVARARTHTHTHTQILSSNPVTSRGFGLYAAAAAACRLGRLEVSGCQVTDEGCRSLSHSLADNRTLQVKPPCQAFRIPSVYFSRMKVTQTRE